MLILCDCLVLQILTTPTKAYNLRTRLVPLSSPDHLNVNGRGDEDVDDIQSEQPPPAMTEMACEALTEELQQVQVQHPGLITYKTDNVTLYFSFSWWNLQIYFPFAWQEQASQVQTLLDQEELKSMKLLQQIVKLEEQVTGMIEEFSCKDEVGNFCHVLDMLC